MRPKFAQIRRADGLPKIHKHFFKVPSFRPIVDATNTPHYGVGTFLTNLLNPLTRNHYTVKDSFEAVNMIYKIPSELFDEGYRYFSFDVTSLFTNVPLNKAINIILEQIYKENLVNTKLRKNTLKKLIKDCCRKTAFSFNRTIRKQKDGVSMCSSLGPVLANIIMTELETVIVEPFIRSGKMKFYIRYVDDTLLLEKEEDIMFIFDKFNSFHKNLKFTIDRFDDNNIHFLDIAFDKNKTDLYYKPTHTGQYSDINSNVPWNYTFS